MGLLSDEYFNTLTNTPSQYKKPQAGGVSMQPEPEITTPSQQPEIKSPAIHVTDDLTREQQIEKFGGVVGSDEYLQYQAERSTVSRLPRELGGALGLRLPGDEEWDGMSNTNKQLTVGKAIVTATGRMIKDLPRAVVGGIASLGVTGIKPFYNLVTGKPTDARSLAAEKKISVPYLGDIPTLYQTQKDAEASGMGPLASYIFAGSDLVLKASTVLPVSEILASTFRPKGSTAIPGAVKNTQPVQMAINEQGIASAKTPSTSEYYSLRQTDAKQFGGNSNTVKWKFTPASENEVSLSVVRSVSKKYKPGDYVKTEFGLKKVEQGDLGPEVKLYSQNVKTEQPLSMTKKVPVSEDIQEAAANVFTELDLSQAGYRYAKPAQIGGGSDIVGVPSTFPEWVDPVLRNKKLFDSLAEKVVIGGEMKLTPNEAKLFEAARQQVASRTGRPLSDITNQSLQGEFETIILKSNIEKGGPIFILPKERMGLSERPITQAQIDTINQIGKMKKMDPAVRDAVVKTITGKDTIGELTERQFTQVAQTLSKFGDKYGAVGERLGFVGSTRSFISPQRHYFDYVEDTYGIPLKTQVYEPLERAARLSRSLDDALQPELDALFGVYAKSKFIEERRLIDAYARGDTGAIMSNTSLTTSVKQDLIDIAGKLKIWDDTHGELLGVGREAYLKNYGGPKLTELGGTFPQYKNLDVTPSKQFFAKFKREGSLDPFIDDPYASRQIYIKEGTKSLHYGPVLQNFEKLYKNLPPQFARQANSYVQEKLGRLGGAEQFVDSMVPGINKRLGINLPIDFSRQMINYGLSSMYSGLVGTPKAIFQQTFQLPTFVYARLGTDFAGEAFVKSFSKLERDRISKGGWLNDISLPYGSELSKEFNPIGKTANAFKTATQATIKPITLIDNDVRIKTFLQAELQWNNTLNLYNTGKIQWNQLESKLQFSSFSKADQNLIRQNLLKGNNENAFNTYMREIIDETSFPYRTGAGARVGYGLIGKLGTGLLNYTIESTNVFGRWVATNQWEKVIRFAGGASAVNETLQDTYGFNFSTTLYQKPMGIISPVFGLIGDTYSYFKAIIDNNRANMNASADDIARTLKSAQPAGIVQRNIKNFFKSYRVGPDETGMYPIYDDYGKLIDTGDFTDIFWGTLVGFPTGKKIEERNVYTDLKNRMTEEQEIKNDLNQLLREGKYDEMEKLIEKTGVMPSQSSMESAYVPRLQRLFQSSSPSLKSEFVPRVFPETGE